MPLHFDRFRFLNDSNPKRFRNESEDKTVELIVDGVPHTVPPGEEHLIPEPQGQEIVLDVPR